MDVPFEKVLFSPQYPLCVFSSAWLWPDPCYEWNESSENTRPRACNKTEIGQIMEFLPEPSR